MSLKVRGRSELDQSGGSRPNPRPRPFDRGFRHPRKDCRGTKPARAALSCGGECAISRAAKHHESGWNHTHSCDARWSSDEKAAIAPAIEKYNIADPRLSRSGAGSWKMDPCSVGRPSWGGPSLFRIPMQSRSVRVKLLDQPIDALDLRRVGGRA